MKASRRAGVVLASGAIVAVGWSAAPEAIPVDPTLSADPQAPSRGGGAQPDAGPSGAPGAEQAFDGPPVSNLRGTYQARIVVRDGEVVDVQAVVAGTSAYESVAVNSVAIPEFRERVLKAQSWDVDAVSGASYTSPAFIESLRGAFEAAGLE